MEIQLHSFFNLCASWWWVVTATPWLLYTWERDSVTHFTGGWVDPRASLDG